MSESNTAVGRAVAAVAVLGERQRQPRAQLRAGQDGVQPVDELRRLSRGASRTCRRRRSRCACIRTWRTADRRPTRWSGTMDQEDRQGLVAARPIFQWHARTTRISTSGQKSAARVLLLAGGRHGLAIAGSSACSPSSTFRSPCPRICSGSTTRHGGSIWSSRRAARPQELERYVRDGRTASRRRHDAAHAADWPRRRPADRRRRATGACTITRCCRR